jgi:hypothetical protein
MISTKKILISCLFTTLAFGSMAQDSIMAIRQDSLKGSITKAREWWDVQYYDISLDIDFVHRKIIGKNTIDYT